MTTTPIWMPAIRSAASRVMREGSARGSTASVTRQSVPREVSPTVSSPPSWSSAVDADSCSAAAYSLPQSSCSPHPRANHGLACTVPSPSPPSRLNRASIFHLPPHPK